VPWDRVHDDAEVLEHVLSEELEELIATKLGNPTHDPHGDPIPTRDGHIEEAVSRSLEECEPGDLVILTRVSDSDPEMLRYLGERGIERGTTLEVVGREPFGGPLNVLVGKRELPLGLGLARAMRVKESS
jgi:DtxR family transcriptional regulator, Mn-dependent transcriptional regulator